MHIVLKLHDSFLFCYTQRMHEFNYLLALGVFVAYVFVDGLYAYYTLAVVKKKRSDCSYNRSSHALSPGAWSNQLYQQLLVYNSISTRFLAGNISCREVCKEIIRNISVTASHINRIIKPWSYLYVPWGQMRTRLLGTRSGSARCQTVKIKQNPH